MDLVIVMLLILLIAALLLVALRLPSNGPAATARDAWRWATRAEQRRTKGLRAAMPLLAAQLAIDRGQSRYWADRPDTLNAADAYLGSLAEFLGLPWAYGTVAEQIATEHMLERGRTLASQREDLIARGVPPEALLVPLAPIDAPVREVPDLIDPAEHFTLPEVKPTPGLDPERVPGFEDGKATDQPVKPDPSHGLIEEDIRDHVAEMNPSSLGQRVAIERTLQDRRNAGEVILGVDPHCNECGRVVSIAWRRTAEWANSRMCSGCLFGVAGAGAQ